MEILLISLLAAFCVGLSKGGLPSVGIMAVPIMSLFISPIKAAALLLPIFVLTDLVGVYLYRKAYSKANLQILIPAGIAGVAVGWASAAYLSERWVALLIGVIGLSFSLYNWFKRQSTAAPTSPSLVKGAFWGTLAGFTSFVSHAGSPPFQIYVLPQKLPKLVFAGTSTLLFACINLAKVLPYWHLQNYNREDLHSILSLVPIAIVGTFVGSYLTKRLPEKWFFRFVQLSLFIVSLRLVWQNI